MEVNTSLNKYFEIIGLLYTYAHPDLDDKGIWDKVAKEYHISADELSRKIGSIPTKYCSAFQKSVSISNQEDFSFFFSDEDDAFVLLLQIVCATHPQWFEGADPKITNEEVSTAFADILSDESNRKMVIPPSDKNIIELLESTGYPPSTCWKMVLFLQSSKEKIQKLSQLIRDNDTSYENALAAINRPLRKLLDAFPHGRLFCNNILQGALVTPTLIYPTLELIQSSGTSSTSFVGLFVNELYQLLDKNRSAQDKILPVLKALSDNSKFDILCSLMKAPKYNLELAEELSLTAATVSHHMNVLLNLRLVDVEKRDGRVYYTITKDTIRETLQSLRRVFLDESE